MDRFCNQKSASSSLAVAAMQVGTADSNNQATHSLFGVLKQQFLSLLFLLAEQFSQFSRQTFRWLHLQPCRSNTQLTIANSFYLSASKYQIKAPKQTNSFSNLYRLHYEEMSERIPLQVLWYKHQTTITHTTPIVHDSFLIVLLSSVTPAGTLPPKENLPG